MTRGTNEVKDIEVALAALLNEVVKRLGQQPPGEVQSAGGVPFAPASHPVSDVEQLILAPDPVLAACRLAITRIGLHLYSVSNSTDAMRTLQDRIASGDAPNNDLRAHVLGTCWAGVGIEPVSNNQNGIGSGLE